MTKAWWDNYIGIPYAEKGRTRDGLDCWGLVRLVHAEHFLNELPSLEGDFENTTDNVHLAEMIAREKEHWEPVDLPREGDVVLFHVKGQMHVGVVTAPGEFLHVPEKQLSVIDRLESPMWKKRFRGCFRYCTVVTPIAYSAAAHPLRTDRIEGMLPPGATVSTIIQILKDRQGVVADMPFSATVWVNGRQVERSMWDHTIPTPGSRIEMRAVARGSGDGNGRMAAGIVVMILATVLAPYLAPAFTGIAGALTTGAAVGNLATSLAFTAISITGNLLINSIFPVRQPDNPGQAERQLLLQGGANRPNPYGSVPVVLGQFRFVPPCAAETYIESNATVSHMRLAVCWGVGPLQVADLQIGNVPLASYEEVEVETLTGVTGESKVRFNAIYGKDVHQISPGIQLLCPEIKVTSVVINTDVYTVTTQGLHGYSTGALVKITENYDALAPGYGSAIVREVESGAITVTSTTTFTLPRVKTGYGPLLTGNFYQIDSTGYTVGVDWGIHNRSANPEDVSPAGAQHSVGAVASDMTLNGFTATATHTYQIRFFIDSSLPVTGSGFQGLAGGVVGAFVTAAGWHEQTIVATGSTAIGVRAAANTVGRILYFEARRVYTTGTGFVSGGDQSLASSFSEYVMDSEADQLKVTLHFPSGLRSVVKEGGNAGDVSPAYFQAVIQYRQLDSSTLVPITPWGNFDKTVSPRTINLARAWFNVTGDEELEKVYQWTRITVDENGQIISRVGAMTASQFANPTGNLLLRLQQANFGVNVTFDRLPALPAGEEHLYDICVFGNAVVTTTDQRDGSVTGCAASVSGLAVTIATGEITRAETENVRLGGEGQPFYQRKDAFTHNVTMNVTRGKYEVRIRRTSASNNTFTFPSGNVADRMSDSYLQTITAYSTNRPITPPVPMAMTALRIKATNQINGNIDGLSGLCTSICLDYDVATLSWIERPTRNPASLLRYLLQHPANIKKVADSKLDLPAFVDFHNFCRTNKFMYDNVLLDMRSVWDVMLDIAAAGRASPTRINGKHSVVIDKPRISIVQHFTPHNSWGFESARALPQHPHAFRVNFNNAEKGYQPDERIVYNDGYSNVNATLFESLTLPGVTIPTTIFKHARFHFAQLKLRPEQYSINVDIEHLVATRGDLVRATHEVPMWGLGSGRIRDRLTPNNFFFRLDEEPSLAYGTDYTMRVRAEDGTSATRTVRLPTEPTVTLVRNSIGTYFNSSGVMQTASANVARFDYDFVSGASLGLLIEEGRTNKFLRSSDFANASWGKGNCTITAAAATAPDGTLTASKMVNTAGANARVSINQAPAATINVKDTATIYMKEGEWRYVRFFADRVNVSEGAYYGSSVVVDLQAGTSTNSAIVKVKRRADGWCRLEITATPSATEASAAWTVAIGPTSNFDVNATVRDGTSGVYVWGAQCETGSTAASFATSYIPTTSAAVSRQADHATMPAGHWYDTTKGTWVIKWRGGRESQQALYGRALSGSNSNSSAVLSTNGATNTISSYDGTLDVSKTGMAGVDFFDVGNTGAVAYSATGTSITAGGVTVTTNGTVLNMAHTSFTLGGNHGTRSNMLNGTIERIRYYPRRFSDAELQSITAGGTVADAEYMDFAFTGAGGSDLVGVHVGRDPRVIETTTALNIANAKSGDLYLLGTLNAESVELIVHSIEPAENLSARLTLVDYSPAVYDSDLEVVPAWDSQITLPPNLRQRTVTQKPTITVMRSDEAIMVRNADGTFDYGLQVAWQVPATLPVRINGVQGEIDFANDNKERWEAVQTKPLHERSITFRNLREGRNYKVRLRFVDEDGRVGPWTTSAIHTVVGKTTPPKAVTGFTAAVDESGSQIELKWNGNTEIDISGYEIREANTNWGKDDNYVYRGVATRKTVAPPKVVGAAKTWYIRAFDRAGLYALAATSVTFTKAALVAPVVQTPVIVSSSNTVDRVQLDWDDATPPFRIKHYLATLTLPDASVRTLKALTSQWSTPINWTGTATLSVKVVDVHGSESPAGTMSVSKSVPNNVGAVIATATRRIVDLDWATVVKTTLPIAGYEVRSTDASFGSTGFLYRGTASQMRAYRMVLGVNNFYVRAYDTDGVYSAASSFVSKTYEVPPTMTTLTLTRRGRYLNFAATGPAQPLDFSHYEFRIKLGGAGGDVWAAFDTIVRSKYLTYEGLTMTALGTYNVSVRMVDTDDNVSAASINAAITIAKIPAP